MKTIKELEKERDILNDKILKIYDDISSLRYNIDILTEQRNELVEQIKDYEKFKEAEEKKKMNKEFSLWITGQTKTDNVGYFEGIVCPSLNIFEYKHPPKGTKEEIIALLEKYDYKMISFSTNFVPCGPWGDDVVDFTLHKRL